MSLSLYYEGQSLEDMVTALRRNYLTTSGWMESADSKLSTRDGRPLPWFTYAAIDFLERTLTPDLAMFEYGGGQSTRYWADRLSHVHSVDHDPAFVEMVRRDLPANARFDLVEEGAALPADLPEWATRHPAFPEPARDTRTYRSGQLNTAFRAYALQLLRHPQDSFDVVVVDGMARVLSTWAAIRHFRRGGFIVFDNSDRDFYAPAFALLDEAGYRRIDFNGLGPINPYAWGTSVFYRPACFPGTRWFAGADRAVAPQAEPAVAPEAEPTVATEAEPEDALGILVLGYNRPHHLQSVLESLRLQGALGRTHVWIDGTQGRGEYARDNAGAERLAGRYPVRELRVQNGHLGIEKMMLDALGEMSARYTRVLVLEDDCFPLQGGIDAFEAGLAEVADRPEIFSVYGHPFGIEPEDDRDFPRFQGWSWAAHSRQIRRLLPGLRELFTLSERDYLARIEAQMTDAIRARLDVTPGRNVLNVLQSAYSWDSATAFLCARIGLGHRRTAQRAAVNTGIVRGIGHFHDDTPFFRRPPFNMVRLSEAWSLWDTTSGPCRADRESYGLDQLDLRIAEALPEGLVGSFIEIGAYDGVTQSNSVLLEAKGWRGLLIEANPGSYARCVRTRPRAIVEHAACVPAGYGGRHTTITDVGLMSMTRESGFSKEVRADWTERGAGFAGRPPQDIDVPAAPMSALLDRHRMGAVDLLLLDVEGAEIGVLEGLDMSRHAPRFIVAEDAYDEALHDWLAARGYTRERVLLERKFTRDCLYARTVATVPEQGPGPA